MCFLELSPQYFARNFAWTGILAAVNRNLNFMKKRMQWKANVINKQRRSFKTNMAKVFLLSSKMFDCAQVGAAERTWPQIKVFISKYSQVFSQDYTEAMDIGNCLYRRGRSNPFHSLWDVI